MAAFDMDDPEAIVSPGTYDHNLSQLHSHTQSFNDIKAISHTVLVLCSGGVGFDINCGVRLLRTNLHERDVAPIKEQLAQSLFDHIPVGVGSKVFCLLAYLWCQYQYCTLRSVSRLPSASSFLTSTYGHHRGGGGGDVGSDFDVGAGS
jgi:hypothetical protein